jgi:hypothetical protein
MNSAAEVLSIWKAMADHALTDAGVLAGDARDIWDWTTNTNVSPRNKTNKPPRSIY